MIKSMHGVRVSIKVKGLSNLKNEISMFQPIVLKAKYFAIRRWFMRNINQHRRMVRKDPKKVIEMNGIRISKQERIYQTSIKLGPSSCLTSLTIVPRIIITRVVYIYQRITRDEVRERISFPGIIIEGTSLVFFRRNNRVEVSNDNRRIVNFSNLC